MASQFEVIDADGHITEEDSQLKKYMEARYRDRAATLTPRDSWDRSLSGTLGTRARDAKSWLDAMDKGGVSTAVLYPTNGLSVGWIREPDVAVAYSKAWNDFCAEEFQKVSPRLKAVALLPLQDPDAAAVRWHPQGRHPRRADRSDHPPRVLRRLAERSDGGGRCEGSAAAAVTRTT